MTKRFGYFGAPKCAAFLSTIEKANNCEKLSCPAAKSEKKSTFIPKTIAS